MFCTVACKSQLGSPFSQYKQIWATTSSIFIISILLIIKKKKNRIDGIKKETY